MFVLPQRASCNQRSAILVQHMKAPEQAQENTSPWKMNVTIKSPVGDISVVTLIRTDTTLDHSQKAEKVWVLRFWEMTGDIDTYKCRANTLQTFRDQFWLKTAFRDDFFVWKRSSVANFDTSSDRKRFFRDQFWLKTAFCDLPRWASLDNSAFSILLQPNIWGWCELFELLEPKLPKNWHSHIDASLSRQPLVKGERLMRYEVIAVMQDDADHITRKQNINNNAMHYTYIFHNVQCDLYRW